ncbi:hypothetical protein ANCCEY_08060 [Ancylostoma ceylanicum]|uniref:Uncharacterized protein n=1 Tax=Ancylostoma ceylanicum TaxID=53326 RepID=A0A0D6LS60_9BILA|nr:hypothetical protein ANCCEY_08060 [Ancylostoma ceylanicum]
MCFQAPFNLGGARLEFTMSYSKSINSNHRAYGSFGPNSKASALFDAAFSKPLPKKRFQAQKSSGTPNDSPTVDSLPSVAEGEPAHSSPKQVFSPPISLPESTSTDGTVENDNVGGVAASLRSTHSPQTGTVRTSSAAFDFDDKEDSPPPSVKRSKMSPPCSSSSKFAAPKERRPVYQHKWTENDDEDNEESGGENTAEGHVASGAAAPTSSAQQYPHPDFMRKQSS